MIVVRTGVDLYRAELEWGLTLRLDGVPTPDALGGYGHRCFQVVSATPEERETLRRAGIVIEEFDFKWAEVFHRTLPAPRKNKAKRPATKLVAVADQARKEAA